MGDRSHILVVSIEKERKEKKAKKKSAGVGIRPQVSKQKNVNQKFNMSVMAAQGIRNQVPLSNSILIHKAYVNKYSMNAAHRNQT